MYSVKKDPFCMCNYYSQSHNLDSVSLSVQVSVCLLIWSLWKDLDKVLDIQDIEYQAVSFVKLPIIP